MASPHKGPLMRIELAVKQTIELSVIWDSMTPMWHHCNLTSAFHHTSLMWYRVSCVLVVYKFTRGDKHVHFKHSKLKQLERLRSEDTPRRLMITHTIESYWIPSQKKTKSKLQIFEFWNGYYTRHTFWSCLIRCANMKWIRWVLLKIQSGHDSVHRRTDGQTDGRTDGQTDKVIPVYPPFNFVEAGGIDILRCFCTMFRFRVRVFWYTKTTID